MKEEFPKLSAPALRALDNAGIMTLEQLSKYSETEISELHGMGPNSVSQLKKALKKKGLSFNKRYT